MSILVLLEIMVDKSLFFINQFKDNLVYECTNDNQSDQYKFSQSLNE